MTERLFVEKWTLENVSDTAKQVYISSNEIKQKEGGKDGNYERHVYTDAPEKLVIQPHGSVSFAINFTARLNNEQANFNAQAAEKQRDDFLQTIKNNFIVESEDPVLNTLFYFSKIRAAESIFDSKMGLVHSPGGGRYYTGTWANDQAEYSGPFFPYLGYATGVQAAMNTYRMFLKNIPPPGKKIWASFEMQGELPCCSKDRGDAAMIAYGATHFVLATGNKRYADTLWPLIQWALDYSEQKKNAAGVIASDADELEGRFPSGKANLSTSSLHYGALVQAARLAKAMGKPYRHYLKKSENLAAAIENYFGARMGNLKTYRYYEGNTTLRSWICLPLVMGLNNRKEGTLDALFSKLWADNGVKIEESTTKRENDVFWDRGTLYAFRGAFKAGAADRALEKLSVYSQTRLLGFHVPYAVEAWPEGSMAHLSAESALYARIFTEGILGLEPMGFSSFSIKPNLPTTWNSYKVKNVKAYGTTFDISVTRKDKGYNVQVMKEGNIIQSQFLMDGKEMIVKLL